MKVKGKDEVWEFFFDMALAPLYLQCVGILKGEGDGGNPGLPAYLSFVGTFP